MPSSAKYIGKLITSDFVKSVKKKKKRMSESLANCVYVTPRIAQNLNSTMKTAKEKNRRLLTNL